MTMTRARARRIQFDNLCLQSAHDAANPKISPVKQFPKGSDLLGKREGQRNFWDHLLLHFSHPSQLQKASATVVMKKRSYPTETFLSNKITRNRIVMSFKGSAWKPLTLRPNVDSWELEWMEDWVSMHDMCSGKFRFPPRGREGGDKGASIHDVKDNWDFFGPPLPFVCKI